MKQIKWSLLTPSQLIDLYSGNKGQTCIKYLDDAVGDSDIPTLKGVAERYGNSCAVSLLSHHLVSLHQLGESVTSKEAFLDAATLILTEYSYLNIQELNYFFRHCKLGTYGKMIWGDRLQYQDLLIGLKRFLKDRGEAIYRKSKNQSLEKSEKINFYSGYHRYQEQKKRAFSDIKAFREIYPKLPSDKSAVEYWNEWKENRELDSILCKYNQEHRD